ncbi:MAG: MAC/perforin domain-containing protein [Alphaproteobacteria bacterium]
MKIKRILLSAMTITTILMPHAALADAQKNENISKCITDSNVKMNDDPQMSAIDVLGKGVNFFKSNLSSTENTLALTSIWFDHKSFINSCYNGPSDPGITEKQYRYYSNIGQLQKTLSTRLNIEAEKNFLSTFKITIDAYYDKAEEKNYNIQGIELMQSALGQRHDIDLDCAEKWRINPTALQHAKKLKPITDQAHDKTAWVNYGDFFENHGTHVIISTTSGTLIRESSFSSSTTKLTEKQFKANACAEYEGLSPKGKNTFDACIGITDKEREDSKGLDTQAKGWYQGGTLSTRNALANAHTHDNPEQKYACSIKLLNEAKESTSAINIRTKPIWEILTEHFRDQDDGEKYIPQMRAMEQYYIGLRSFNCQEIKSPNDENWFLRKFEYDETRSTAETPVYQCAIQKVGCHSDASCIKTSHGKYSQHCYCAGKECVVHKNNIPDLRTDPPYGHYNNPVNSTCNQTKETVKNGCKKCTQNKDATQPIWQWEASMQETPDNTDTP